MVVKLGLRLQTASLLFVLEFINCVGLRFQKNTARLIQFTTLDASTVLELANESAFICSTGFQLKPELTLLNARPSNAYSILQRRL